MRVIKANKCRCETFRYRLPDSYILDLNHIGVVVNNFYAAFLNIEKNILTVKKGYCWDSLFCFSFFDLFIIGLPEGCKDASGNPKTYYASLVWSLLSHYKPCTIKQALKIYYSLLDNFALRNLYFYLLKKNLNKLWYKEDQSFFYNCNYNIPYN